MNQNRILKVVPTLIIGLGGTGALGVQYAKRKIEKKIEKYTYSNKVIQKIPFIEYLVLDTTTQEEFIKELTGDQIINMGHKNLTRVINLIGLDPAYDVINWFPDNIDPGQIDSGARGVRSIGRLCFFLSKPIIERSLRDKIRNITDFAEVDRSLKENFKNVSMEPASSIDVHLITSLCGGTGSACLFDTAYLVKEIVENVTKQNTNSIAHLMTMEPFGSESGIGRTTREYLNYNFAVSISELEHFNKTGKWEVKYLDKTTVKSNEKPFSFAYLLGNKEGESLSKKHICEAIGETISLYSVYSESRFLKGLLDNIRAHVINNQDTLGYQRTYSSYNIRILSSELDKQTIEISNLIAGQFIADILLHKATPAIMQSEEINSIKYIETCKDNIRFERFRDIITLGCNITGSPFDTLHHDLSGGVLKRNSKIAANIDLAMSLYDQYFKAKNEIKSDIQDGIKDAFENFLTELGKNLHRLIVEDCGSLNIISELLDRLESEINVTITHSNKYKNTLGEAGIDYDIKMRLSIEEGKTVEFTNLALQRLHFEVLRPIFQYLIDCYLKLLSTISEQKKSCKNAQDFLREAKELLRERRESEYSFTIHSIWTKELVTEKIKSSKQLMIGKFIDSIKQAYLNTQKGTELECKGIEFIKYFNVNNRERKLITAKFLSEASEETINKEIRSLTMNFNFNRSEEDNEFPALRNDKIYEFVESASAAWQIDRGGEDIASVSITNCPRNSIIGKVINDFGKNISFLEENGSTNELFVFCSEHGVSVRRLLNLKSAIDSVVKRLTSEHKTEISELCLDPGWHVESPIPLERFDPLALFSLGLMFDIIKQKFESFYFINREENVIELSVSININKPCLRKDAFQGFLRLESRDEADWRFLRGSIIEMQEKLKTKDELVLKLKNLLSIQIKYLNELKTKTDSKEEKSHLDNEIRAVNFHIIRHIDNYIKSRGLKEE